MSLSCRYPIARPPRLIIVPTIPKMIAMVSVPPLREWSELDWMVACDDGRRVVVFSEGQANLGISFAVGW